jgi:hypothetical protein
LAGEEAEPPFISFLLRLEAVLDGGDDILRHRLWFFLHAAAEGKAGMAGAVLGNPPPSRFAPEGLPDTKVAEAEAALGGHLARERRAADLCDALEADSALTPHDREVFSQPFYVSTGTTPLDIVLEISSSLSVLDLLAELLAVLDPIDFAVVETYARSYGATFFPFRASRSDATQAGRERDDGTGGASLS